MRITTGPKTAGLAVHWHVRLWPCVGEHKSGRALSEPRALAAGDDVAHENRADHAAELQRLALGAPHVDAGPESRRVLVFGRGHSFAGVNQHPLADRRLDQAAGAGFPVLDIFADVDHCPSVGLTNGYGLPQLTHPDHAPVLQARSRCRQLATSRMLLRFDQPEDDIGKALARSSQKPQTVDHRRLQPQVAFALGVEVLSRRCPCRTATSRRAHQTSRR